jgi:SpoVK/Ycf46/Vps4 family AAA+-type ATPase
MNFYELLKSGMSVDEINALVTEELKAADEKLYKEKEEEKLKEKALKDREITLNDARAHLISALGLYNEVFKITEFTDEDAEDLAEALKEAEDFMIKHPDLIKMYMGKGAAKVKYKSSILDNLDDGFWRVFKF